MTLKKQRSMVSPAVRERRTTPAAVAEEILEEKLEDIATILCKSETDRSRLYDEVLAMVERGLVRIATPAVESREERRGRLSGDQPEHLSEEDGQARHRSRSGMMERPDAGYPF